MNSIVVEHAVRVEPMALAISTAMRSVYEHFKNELHNNERNELKLSDNERKLHKQHWMLTLGNNNDDCEYEHKK